LTLNASGTKDRWYVAADLAHLDNPPERVCSLVELPGTARLHFTFLPATHMYTNAILQYGATFNASVSISPMWVLGLLGLGAVAADAVAPATVALAHR